MRNSYLESYYNVLPKTQQDRLLSILKRRFDEGGQTPDDSSLQKQLESLIAQLQKPLGDPLIQYRKQEKFGKISSKDYNSTIDEAFVDLGALFKQNNTITKTIKVHRLLNESVLSDVRSAMTKVENDIIVYKVIRENKSGITDVKFNSFYKNDNKSTDKVFAARVDVDTNSITLPMGSDQSSLSIGGLAMADIDITHYGGGIRGTIEDESHSKEKAIDESAETFWGEVILTDEPIRQVYDGETVFGAVCEVVITLFRADQINYIKLDPFANYPLTVLKIFYSDSDTGDWVNLNLTEQSSTFQMGFHFEEVMAKRIKIVLNQRNPSVNTYKIPRRVINNAQMWQQIVDREFSISTDTTTPIQATQDMIDYVSGWQAYVDASEEFRKKLIEIGKPEDYIYRDSISESIYDSATKTMDKSGVGTGSDSLKLDIYKKKPEPEDELVEVRKYEYLYGSYNIDIRKVWYMEIGEYLSPIYTANGTIVEARLDVTETTPSGTTIEYQIATRPGEWRNVLPTATYISRERLDIDSVTNVGTLRFPCSGSLTAVYRSDNEIPETDYTFTSSNSEVKIGDSWYSAASAYTVSYSPSGISDINPSGVVVSFIDDTLQYGDETTVGSTSRQFKVELQHYPYVDYSIINNTLQTNKANPDFYFDDGRWENVKAYTVSGIAAGEYYDVLSVTVDGYVAINRTDYYDNIRPALTQYSLADYPYYEYIHAGKNLYFNTDLSGLEVKCRYKYLNDYIQFRALLRRNNRGNVSITPVLEDFTLKLRTI